MKITIIGQGYVGLPLALHSAQAGYSVIGFDTNETLVSNLGQGVSHISDVPSSSLISAINNLSYTPTTDVKEISGSEIIIIAVPTPLDAERKPDLQFLETASQFIADNVQTRTLVINESTSYPGTLRNFIRPLIEKGYKKNFLFAASPERINPGNNNWNLKNTPRVVSGLCKEATEIAFNFYSKICENVTRVSSPEIAEAAKIFENTFRQVNIALVNELSLIASKLNFSANEALDAAETKPFGFMRFYPSIGVGGHCIPVDPSYLSFIAGKEGVDAKFINLANETNLSRPKMVANLIESKFGPLRNIKVQIAGISYKADVSDMRESPIPIFIDELSKFGCEVTWHDPLIKTFNGKTSTKMDPLADLGIIATPHSTIDFTPWLDSKIRVLDLSTSSKNFGWPKFF